MSCSFRAKSADTSGTRKGSLARSPYTATEEAAAALVRICRVEGGYARPDLLRSGRPTANRARTLGGRTASQPANGNSGARRPEGGALRPAANPAERWTDGSEPLRSHGSETNEGDGVHGLRTTGCPSAPGPAEARPR